MTRRHATLPTPLGELIVVADGEALVGIYFPGHWHPPAVGSIGVEVDAHDDELITRFGEQLTEYLDGTRTTFDLPLAADRRRVPAGGVGDAAGHPIR